MSDSDNKKSLYVPSDRLFSQKEWERITNAFGHVTDSSVLKNLTDQIIVVAGHYRANALMERPEAITGHRRRSPENRSHLRKSTKAVRKFREILVNKPKSRQRDVWTNRVIPLLRHNEMRARLSRVLPVELNEHVPFLLAPGNVSHPNLDMPKTIAVLEAMEKIYNDDLIFFSATGPQPRQARALLLEALIAIWQRATGKYPTISTSGAGVVSGNFVEFVQAVFQPIASQLNDNFDTYSLRDATKKAVYAGGAQKSGK